MSYARRHDAVEVTLDDMRAFRSDCRELGDWYLAGLCTQALEEVEVKEYSAAWILAEDALREVWWGE